jgi:hypothetical protein
LDTLCTSIQQAGKGIHLSHLHYWQWRRIHPARPYYTLHIYTTGSGEGYTFLVYTAKAADGYTLHFYTAGVRKR